MLKNMNRSKLFFLTQFWIRIGLEYAENSERHIGYLANIKPTNLTDKNGGEVAAILLYFIKEDGKWIKAI